MHVGLPCMKLSLSPSNQKHHGKAARTCSAKDAWGQQRFRSRLTVSMKINECTVSELFALMQ